MVSVNTPADIKAKKYRRFFDGLDLDGSGKISQNDFDLFGQRYAKAKNLPTNDADVKRLTSLLCQFWVEVIQPCDRDGDGEVSFEEMLAGFKQSFTSPADYPSQIEPITVAFFKIADQNNNGTIEENEFIDIFSSSLGASRSDIEKVFRGLDSDNSGALTRDEYDAALSEFFYGDDPNSLAAHLFGPLGS